MARKDRTVTIPKFELCDNRDLGKTFYILEWDAARADSWIQDLTFAFNKGGGEVRLDAIRGAGWEGIAVVGLNTFLRGNGDKEEIKRLTNELLECVTMIRDPAHPETRSPLVSPDDIEEVATRYWLRDQVVSVHTNFSPLAALSRLISSIMTKSPDSGTTQT